MQWKARRFPLADELRREVKEREGGWAARVSLERPTRATRGREEELICFQRYFVAGLAKD